VNGRHINYIHGRILLEKVVQERDYKDERHSNIHTQRKSIWRIDERILIPLIQKFKKILKSNNCKFEIGNQATNHTISTIN
jgi:hypothetical protein